MTTSKYIVGLSKHHGIYLARWPDCPVGDEIVLVKSTPRYHEAAYHLLPDHHHLLVPALYSCTRVIGGVYVVIMEYLKDAKPPYQFFPPSHIRPPRPDVHAEGRALPKLDFLHKRTLFLVTLGQQMYSTRRRTIAVIYSDGGGRHGESEYSTFPNTGLSLGVGR